MSRADLCLNLTGGYVMGADGDVMQEKPQRVAGHRSGIVVRLI